MARLGCLHRGLLHCPLVGEMRRWVKRGTTSVRIRCCSWHLCRRGRAGDTVRGGVLSVPIYVGAPILTGYRRFNASAWEQWYCSFGMDAYTCAREESVCIHWWWVEHSLAASSEARQSIFLETLWVSSRVCTCKRSKRFCTYIWSALFGGNPVWFLGLRGYSLSMPFIDGFCFCSAVAFNVFWALLSFYAHTNL